MNRNLVEAAGFAFIALALGLVWLPAGLAAVGVYLILAANILMADTAGEEQPAAAPVAPAVMVEEAHESIANVVVGTVEATEAAPSTPWWHRIPLKPNAVSAAKTGRVAPAAPAPSVLLREYAQMSPLERAIANQRSRPGRRIV